MPSSDRTTAARDASGASRPSMPERIANVVAVVGCVFFALAAAWGLFGTVGQGHWSAMSGTGIMGENIVHWKIWGAVWSYSLTKPTPADYFCHHPLGPFWTSALFIAIFGHRDFVLSLPAVLASAATPPLLWGMARRAWGPIPGAAAVLGFAVLPITLGFARFHNLEVEVMFGCALFFWGHARMLERPRRRYLVASVLGVLVATSYDWPGYIAVGVVLGWGLLRLALPERVFGDRVKMLLYARWWALSSAVAVGTLLLWVGLFAKADKIGDWIGMGQARAGGAGIPLKTVLQARRYWIEAMFTPLAILVGKIALPVCALRVLVRRRDAEVYAIAAFAAAAVHYVVFKNGADVHIFWPHYFGAYYALAFAVLVATLAAVVRWPLARVIRLVRGHDDALRVAAAAGAWTALGATVVCAALLLPDSLRICRLLRQTGGRYNDNGSIIRTDQELLFVIQRVLKPQMRDRQILDVSPTVNWGWEHAWVLHGVNEWANAPPESLGRRNDAHPFWIARASGLGAGGLQKIGAGTHARLYGDVVVVDEREPKAPLDAFKIVERQPNPLEWYFISGIEPMRSVSSTPDPFLTWEWRFHLGQAADPISAEPQTLDELRIAHNYALANGDTDKAEHLRERIDQQLERRQVRFDDGTKLIGVRVTQGVEPKVECWFEAGGPTPGEAGFTIHSVVEKKDPLSLIPPDATERNMAYMPSLSTRLWKKGFLYVIRTPLLHRVGTERYWGFWTTDDGTAPPRRIDKEPTTTLAEIR